MIHVAIFRNTTVGHFVSSCLLWSACEGDVRGPGWVSPHMQPAARRPVTTVTWQEPQIGAFELQPHLSSPRLDGWENTNMKEQISVEVRFSRCFTSELTLKVI